MSWIKLLYPQPYFEMNFGPLWARKVHIFVKQIVYYLTQTLALLGLILIYFCTIFPIWIILKFKRKDILNVSILKNKASYLTESSAVSEIDFKRMY